ncbi:MAG: chemotaxis protein CheD [Burkholderiaceae bacterium]|nr:chemotaxis protein CheD [Burkholderiaceae bacterium]
MAPASHITDIFLLPGEYFVGGAGHRIRTLLGSCVSIILWHPERKIGTMSHFLLSSRNQGKSTGLNSRYGAESLALMLSELRTLGVDPKECQAKIFGGGQMFPGSSQGIGRQNGEEALRLLQAHGIRVVSESLYGMGHRNIIFDISSGHVWSRHVTPGQSPVEQASQRPHARRTGLHATLTQAAQQQAVEALAQAALPDDTTPSAKAKRTCGGAQRLFSLMQ